MAPGTSSGLANVNVSLTSRDRPIYWALFSSIFIFFSSRSSPFSFYQPALASLILNSIISSLLRYNLLTPLILFSLITLYLSNAALITFMLKFSLWLATFIRSLFSVCSKDGVVSLLFPPPSRWSRRKQHLNIFYA